MRSTTRSALFFVPHVALIAVVVIGEHFWLSWLPAFIVLSLVLPLWTRWAGSTWPRRRAFLLGPGCLIAAYVIAALCSGGGGWGDFDFLLPLILLLAAAFLFAYSTVVFELSLGR